MMSRVKSCITYLIAQRQRVTLRAISRADGAQETVTSQLGLVRKRVEAVLSLVRASKA